MDKGLSWDYREFWRQKEARNKYPQPDGSGCWWEVSGKSRGYWIEIARSKPEREAEARHSTKFGQHWAGSRQRPNGRSYTTSHSPYDPEPGVGIWRGRTAPSPRIGAAAPKRWPAEAPDGLRPHEYKWAQVFASRLITDRLRLSDDRCNYQRLRDLKVHILERRRHSGSLFQDKAEPTAAQFARGVRWAELESIELYRRHDQLRWFIDAKVDDNCDGYASTEPVCERSDAVPLSKANIPHGTDSHVAALAGFAFEEVDNTVAERRRRKRGGKQGIKLFPKSYLRHTSREIRMARQKEYERLLAQFLAKGGQIQVCAPQDRRAAEIEQLSWFSPPLAPALRERKKAGRKPAGERAMITTERVAQHLAKQKQLKAPATHGRVPAGTVPPPPLGLAVPVPPFASTDEGSAMSELATLSVEAGLSSASRNAEPAAGPRRYPADAAGHSGADIFAGLMGAYTGTPACLSRRRYTLSNST